MMAARHSPVPFGEPMLQDESGVYNVRDANGQSTVCAYNAADAAFVRRAVNNHESLLAALQHVDVVLDAVMVGTEHGLELRGMSVRAGVEASAKVKQAILRTQAE